MFERFTERARQVVVLAHEEARTLGHNHIGTEHILLGLVREEEGLAARVLESLEITIERARSQVLREVASGGEVTSGQIPFTPRAKKLLELALLDEAQDFQTAARFRDRERELEQQACAHPVVKLEVLQAIRRRLGIPVPPEGAQPPTEG